MKLSPSGKNRLDAMKKALAAGLPLAGLLVAAACSKDVTDETTPQPQRNWRYLGELGKDVTMELDGTMGELIPDEPEDTPSGSESDLMEMPCEDLIIAEEVPTRGIVLSSAESLPPKDGCEVDWHSDEDVVIRVKDATSAENGEP